MSTNHGTLATLIEQEIGEKPTRTNSKRVTEPSRDLFGLALSGGGIRSATFNLGLLQGLQQFRLLDKLDYLSTVSGGGYVGSFWSAWRARDWAVQLMVVDGEYQLPAEGVRLIVVAREQTGTLRLRIFGADGGMVDLPEEKLAELAADRDALARLHELHGEFRTRKALTSEETRELLEAVVSLVGEFETAFPQGTGCDGRAEPREVRHLREYSNFLAPHLGVLSWDTGRMLVTLVSSIVPSLLTALSVLTLAVLAWCLVTYGLFALGPTASLVTLVGTTALLLIGLEALWQRRGEERDLWGYAEAWLGGLFMVGFVWWLMLLAPELQLLEWYGTHLPVIGNDRPAMEWLYLLAPVVPWLVASALLSWRRWLGSPGVTSHLQRMRRTSFDRVHARFLFAAALWTVITLLWWIGALLWGLVERGFGVEVTTGLGGATAAVVWAFSRIQKRLSSEFKRSFGTGLTARLRPVLPQLLAYLAIVLMVVATIAGIIALDRSDLTLRPVPVWVAGLATVILLLAALRFNPNELGLHTFYRARLARAYLGASNPDEAAFGKTEEREADDLLLTDLFRDRPPLRRACHLICCAANHLASRELGNLHRGAKSAVLSPVGFSVDGESRFWGSECPVPTLSAAVTASGAAFNPLMGDKSRELGPAVTFLMAAFNLRLGIWLPWVAETGPVAWLERRLVGLPFLKEMFGLARAPGRHVHLSDGGHFENTAVYELIRRHCRFIIASDCGMDPTVSFDDFGNLVRRVRADFGVDIRIDLSPLRPDEHGIARQPMVVGDIHYPEGDTGILLLFKPSLTGSEPADVAQYRTRNRVFPHETTIDQFYDEAQWEAYRRLGEHAAHAAFRQLVADLHPAADDYLQQVLFRSRREWQAMPEGFGERLSHYADRIEKLDALLREAACATLLREVYKELDDLDRDKIPALALAGDEGIIRPAETTDPVEQNRLPDPQDLAPSLHLIRRVLLLMQEVYTRENLEEHCQHPMYLGVINYFARWTSAPLFRLWWPLLKTMYPQPFTRFVERLYGLRAGQRRDVPVTGQIGKLGRNIRGYAMSCWRQQRSRELKQGQWVLPFMLELKYLEHCYVVQAAQVVVVRSGPDLVWDAEDFYVPLGLWGVGIGESFLRQMRAAGAHPARVQCLYVRVRTDPTGGEAAKKQAATERQLYRSAGFQEVAERHVPESVRQRIALRDLSSDGDPRPTRNEEVCWLKSERTPAPSTRHSAASGRGTPAEV